MIKTITINDCPSILSIKSIFKTKITCLKLEMKQMYCENREIKKNVT